jgi:uncharacterized protein YcfL
MRHKLITLLLAVVSLILLTSCSAPRYVTVDNQVYAQPGDKVIIEVKTDIESVTGAWSSYYVDSLVGKSVQRSDEPLQLSLRDSESSNEITATVTHRQYWPDKLPDETRIVIIPVEITVPANASVSSTWSGFLLGTIRVPVPMPGSNLDFIERIKGVNVAVTLHVTT